MESAQSQVVGRRETIAPGWLGKVRLRILVAMLSGTATLPFLALAMLDPRGAAVALGGALLVAAHGLFWLIVLRRNRARLRRAGLRW